MNTNKTIKKTTSLRLNDSLYRKIEEMAKAQNRSINNLIETILLSYTDDTEMSKDQYKQKILKSQASGLAVLSEEEQKNLFKI